MCADSILALGATAMALHYSTIIQRNHHCHIPFLTGPSGTGKTTALRSGLSLLGAHEQRFFSRGTTEKYSIHCCESSFPIGCDDPLSEVQTGQLVVDLYNGAKVTTVKRGDKQDKQFVSWLNALYPGRMVEAVTNFVRVAAYQAPKR